MRFRTSASFLKSFWQRLYRLYAVRANVTLGKHIHLGIGTILWAPKQLSIGDNVYVGKGCTIECNGVIGDGVLIGNNVGIVGRHDHDFSAIGTHIRSAPWIGEPDYPSEKRDEGVYIGDDVWIGYGAIVLTGATIGRGAIVAAGSIVLGDVAPYSIVAGAPAEHRRWRFSEEEIVEHERLLALKAS